MIHVAGSQSNSNPPPSTIPNPPTIKSEYSNQKYPNIAQNQSSLPVASNDMMFVPISDLNPYLNKWTIKARVTSKSQIRSWSKPTGNGQLFSIDLLDENDSEIRGTFFNQDVDKFYTLLEKDEVYTFSNGSVKPANKRFNSLNNNYEISFNSRSIIIIYI